MDQHSPSAPLPSSTERPWRVLVVEDEENLNWSIVTSLRKEHYDVEGTRSAEEAIRFLWTQDFDVIISDIKMPGMDGFELLTWVRTHRPGLRIMMMTAFGSPVVQTQALQQGVVTYLEKPFDLRVLKDELRRLLYRTGFSASLDAFDLLDVVQIINMARKSITMRVEIGVEGKGLLRFVNGELVWAEFGELAGEEAFFAIAAHKTGILTEERGLAASDALHSQPARSNVSLPVSRLIMQALQYRDKYAQRDTGQLPATRVPAVTSSAADRAGHSPVSTPGQPEGEAISADAHRTEPADATPAPLATSGEPAMSASVATGHDEPAAGEPGGASNQGQQDAWQALLAGSRGNGTPSATVAAASPPRTATPPVDNIARLFPADSPVPTAHDTALTAKQRVPSTNGMATLASAAPPALMQVLAAIGSEAPGFTAVAVLRSDGMVVAQYSRAPADLQGPAGHLATVVQGVLRALLLGGWGDYEDTVIAGSTHYVLLRRLPLERGIFQLLVTTRESNLGLCRVLLRSWEQSLLDALK